MTKLIVIIIGIIAVISILCAAIKYVSQKIKIAMKNSKNIHKGKKGECIVARKLKELSDEYTVLNDIMIDTPNGTAQIDHIVVSVYGIFVIETKNYSGVLYGESNDTYWEQKSYGRFYKIYNPLKQNQGHVYALKNALYIKNDDAVKPILVTLKNCNCCAFTIEDVTKIDMLISTIGKYYDPILTEYQVEKYIANIKKLNITDKDKRKKHIETVNNKKM